MKKVIFFITVISLLLLLFFIAVTTGSLDVTFMQLIRGLFVTFDPVVAAIYDARFPRIFVAILAGAGVSIAGLLFQSILKNPLADPGMMGISTSATVMSTLLLIIFPSFSHLMPFAAIFGAILGFMMIYSLAYKDGANPTRFILIGIALNALLMGILDVLSGIMGGSSIGSEMRMNFQNWRYVHLLLIYVGIGFVLAFLAACSLNLMRLSDQTVASMGVSVNKQRFYIAFIGAVLVGVASGIVGPIPFLGLIVPHMAKLIIGYDHKVLIPATALLGALTFLFADTVGRTVMAPHVISPSIVMAMLGGPLFIYLIRRNGHHV